jgi:hypothetical protein
MSESQPPQQSSRPAAKPRNPVEKFLVRGLILALLVLVAIEWYFRSDHQKTYDALQAKVAAVDKEDGKPVTETEVKAVFGDRKPTRTEDFGPANPSRMGAKRVDIYSWFTLRPDTKREIYVFYGTKGRGEDVAEVIAVQTDDKIEEIARQDVPAVQAPGAGGGMMGPPGGMGGQGMRGGGRGGPPGQHDPNATSGAKAASDDDKPDADKPADEKPTEAKTEKSDSDQE